MSLVGVAPVGVAHRTGVTELDISEPAGLRAVKAVTRLRASGKWHLCRSHEPTVHFRSSYNSPTERLTLRNESSVRDTTKYMLCVIS
jgi:hypothetical protein